VGDTAIRVENLGKRYRINAPRKRVRTLRESAVSTVVSPFDYLRSSLRKPTEEETVWALRGVSFDVERGEVVGIIGSNGAGKSTLLKVLTRITEPTEGRAVVNGRVASLLEVGTGFHPELTGRENVYLNGAILGMRKAETDRKFDEIVEFSGVERFIDTPVKRYSTGMSVRLAFAVAAHLEPEILLVDEVLAVGDTAFQRKCVGKMGEVASQGRTVLFVSHNMSVIRSLCSRGILLGDGQILMDGPTDEVMEKYLGGGVSPQGERTWPDTSRAPGNDVVRLLGIRTKSSSGEVCSQFDARDAIELEFEYAVLREGYQLCAGIELLDPNGVVIVLTFDDYILGPWGDQEPREVGSFISSVSIPGDFLNEGNLTANLRIFSPPSEANFSPHVCELDVLRFAVGDEMDRRGVPGSYPFPFSGLVRQRLHWSTERL